MVTNQPRREKLRFGKFVFDSEILRCAEIVPPQGSAKGRWSSLEEATYTSLEQPAQDSKAPTAPRLGAMTRAILTLTSDEDELADQGPEVEAAIQL